MKMQEISHLPPFIKPSSMTPDAFLLLCVSVEAVWGAFKEGLHIQRERQDHQHKVATKKGEEELGQLRQGNIYLSLAHQHDARLASPV